MSCKSEIKNIYHVSMSASEGISNGSSELHCQKVIQELVNGSTRKTVRDELDLVVLPRQLWCCLKDTAGGETCCEVGWLFEKGRAMTSKCIFSDNGKLKEIAMACESAAPAQ